MKVFSYVWLSQSIIVLSSRVIPDLIWDPYYFVENVIIGAIVFIFVGAYFNYLKDKKILL